MPIYYLMVPRLMAARDSEMLSLILFFGLSQVIEAVVDDPVRHHRTLHPGAHASASGRSMILGRADAAAPGCYSAAVSAVCVICWSISTCTAPGSAR